MDIDKILEGLNFKNNISDISSGSFQLANLNELERTLIEAYEPYNVLIVYGTLAPNAPNHHIVEHIKGDWHEGIVRGVLLKEGWGAEEGYWGFKHTNIEEKKEKIPAFVLFSDELPTNWTDIDEFEGDEYKRLLAVYELKNGYIGVGNIYAIHENVS
ncbi:MAG: hypothetical protein JNL70_25475 [Saprospiraceae bacterium]|nr:hypothetical protein [Saprospiraceae bacterium]